MLKKTALIFGIVFVAIGILGFVPGITTVGGYLLGIFHVNAVHNIIHLATSIVALLCTAWKHPESAFRSLVLSTDSMLC